MQDGHANHDGLSIATGRRAGRQDLRRIVAQAADGDQDAWRQLVASYRRLVLAVARRSGSTAADAADISQPVWMRLVEHVGSIHDPDSLGGWLAVTTRRETIRALRKVRREVPTAEQQVVDRPVDQDLDAGLQRLIAEERFDLRREMSPARAMFDYVGQVIADKRRQPGDDILTALIQAEEVGDRLETEEIQAQVLLLYVAGHETTANLIGDGMINLFRFPEQMELLRADSGLDANAVEEVLRYDSPAQFTRRVNREPLEVGGITIPEGSLLTLALGSANRDPRKWGPTADILDVARPGANEHVSFGGGSHFCLGNALARLEAQAALPRLVRRFPRMEPASPEPAWMQRITLRGVETLPVVLR